MTDDSKKVNATITVVFKSGAVVLYHVNEIEGVLDRFLSLYRAALVNKVDWK